jgi:hypothetical protein
MTLDFVKKNRNRSSIYFPSRTFSKSLYASVGISTKYPKVVEFISKFGKGAKKMVLEILLKIMNGLFLMDLT